jgi:hypothetical protein
VKQLNTPPPPLLFCFQQMKIIESFGGFEVLATDITYCK